MGKSIAAAVVGVMVAASCDMSVAYHHYEPVPITGWSRGDTMVFSFMPTSDNDTYDRMLCVRITDSYPFTNISLVVESMIYKEGILSAPHNDTLQCRFFDKEGALRGKGVDHYTYEYPLPPITLLAGDSLVMAVRHNMRRETLLGVTDVGIKVSDSAQ